MAAGERHRVEVSGLNDTGRRRSDAFFYFLVYTLVFVLVAMGVFVYFVYNGKSFVWQDDGVQQHFRALAYYGSWLREAAHTIFVEHSLSLPTFSLSMGMGADLYTTLSYYVIGDPLALFTFFVPAEKTVYLYDTLVLLRFYLAGLAFSWYCFQDGARDELAVLTGTVTYVFSGYMLFAALRHPYFATPVILLPLLLGAVDRYMRSGHWKSLVLWMFVGCTANFYFFYMLVILLLLYYVVRYGGTIREGVRRFAGRTVALLLYGLLGIVMAGVLFLPVVMTYLSDARGTVDYDVPLFYDLGYYTDLLDGFLSFGMKGYWTLLGFGGLSLVALLLVITRCRKYKKLFVCVVLCVIGLCLPVVGHVMNGMTYVCNRWSFAFAMVMGVAVVRVVPDLLHLSRRNLLWLMLAEAIWMALCLFGDLSTSQNGYAEYALSLLIVMGLLFAQGMKWTRARRSAARLCILASAAAGVLLMAAYGYSWRKTGYMKAFYAESQLLDHLYIPNDGTYVYDHPDTVWNNEARTVALERDAEDILARYSGDDLTWNASMFEQVSSTQSFWSLSNPWMSQLTDELGNLDPYNFRQVGFDDRTVALTLAGVKYNYTQNPALLPYGYEPVYTAERAVDEEGNLLPPQNLPEAFPIYRNTRALPFGYTYDAQLSDADYEQMGAAQREEAMLQAVHLSRESSLVPVRRVKSQVSSLPFTVTCSSADVTVQGNSFVVTRGGSSVTLDFTGVKGGETYLDIEGLQYSAQPRLSLYEDSYSAYDPLDLYSQWMWQYLPDYDKNKTRHDSRYWTEPQLVNLEVHFSGGDALDKTISYFTPSYAWYEDKHDFLVNGTYSKKARKAIKITFSNSGIYSFDSLSVLHKPLTGYTDACEALAEESLQEVDLHAAAGTLATSQITGRITVGKNKILVMALPWSEGWSAFVDGQRTELLRANTAFMGLELKRGTHEIELRYATPGLLTGIRLSLAGWGIFLVLWIAGAIRRGSTEKKSERKSGRRG